MPDVVEIIKQQHREVEDLLRQAEEKAEQKSPETMELLRRVGEMLKPHSDAEESFVYPRIRERESQEEDQVHDSVAEHQHIDHLLEELLAQNPDEPGFDGKLAAMVGELRHHIEEEEQDLLPVLEQDADDEERAELGRRFAEATE